MDLAVDLQETFIVDPRGSHGLQTHQSHRKKGLGLIQIPDQRRLGVDFIDILTPRPAAAGINRLQFGCRNRQIVGNGKVFHGSS